MSQTKFVPVKHAITTRTRMDGSGGGEGCGRSKHLYVGAHKDGGVWWIYKSYLVLDDADMWTGVGRILSATLPLFTDEGDTYGSSSPGLFELASDNDRPKIKLRILEQSFHTGNNLDGVFNSTDYTNPATSPSGESRKAMRADANGLTRVDITGYANSWAPRTVKQSNGKAGLHKANRGLVLLPYIPTNATRGWSGWSDRAPNPIYYPQVELVYEEGLTTPDTPVNLLPSGAVAAIEAFGGDFSDSRPEAYLSAAQAEIYAGTATAAGQVVTGTLVKSYSQKASATEKQLARSNIVPSALNIAVTANYKWRLRHQNEQGQWSLWSGLVTFSLTHTPPTAPTLTPSGSSFDSLSGVHFKSGQFTGQPGAKLLAYRIQLAQLSAGDPLWDDPDAIRWDTGKVLVAIGVSAFDSLYGGQPLAAAAYTWRAQWWDQNESLSDWAYAPITLTAAFVTEPGNESAPQVNPQAPWRIVIYGMGASRGPGAVLAILADAKSVGGSIMYNSPGELHFTLSVDHPQVTVIEPKQTHYALQMFVSDGWRDIFNGLVWDFDATDTDVVFYGIDYLSLFDQIVDDRFDPSKPDLASADGGSKYVDMTIHDVIVSQIDLAIGLTDSPVGFIHRGTIDAMNEHLTMWTTMQSYLQVINGLLDSHKQGTGKRSRVRVYHDSGSNQWKIAVDDDAGITRDNLRLRYGELVNGYRVIPFGTGWGSRVNAIGRDRVGSKVFYRSASAPGIDTSVWGRFDLVTVIENVTDENDLARRVKQAAVHAGKLGKQLGLGIRSGLLLPRNGYDLCDAIPVEIIHGVVDTTRYGSGYWIINGIAWEGSDNGSSTVILTILPREDSTAPDDDLIPSVPISTQQEWQIGWIPPDPLQGVRSRFYLDQSTGIVYTRSDSGGVIAYVPGGTAMASVTIPVPPSAPTGLALSSSTVTDSLGGTTVSLLASIDPVIDASTRMVYFKLNYTLSAAASYDGAFVYDTAVYDATVDLSAGPTRLVPMDSSETEAVVANIPKGSTVVAQAYAADVYGNISDLSSVASIVMPAPA